MPKNKTIREALEYVQTMVSQTNETAPTARMMARMMIDTIIVNLDEGKTIDDEMNFG